MSIGVVVPPEWDGALMANPGYQPLRRHRSSRMLRSWAVEVVVLGVVGVGLPITLAVHYGTFGTPVSDDWAYALATFHLARTGRFFLYHWVTINFVGQALLALPVVAVFGPRLAALDAWTCCVGFCGLLATCRLARSLGLSRPVSLATSVGLALTPVWLQFSASFMTDVPAISLMMMALSVLATDRRVDRYVTPAAIGALILGLAAFTIRETTAPVLVGIVLARAWRNGRPRRRQLRELQGWLATSGAFFVIAVAEYAWRHTLPGEGYQPPPAFDPRLLAATFVNGWVWPLAGLLLLPVACHLGGPRALRRSWELAPWKLLTTVGVLPGLLLVTRLALVEHTWLSGFTPPAGVLLAAIVLPFGNQGFDLSPMAVLGAQRWVLIGVDSALSVLALSGWVLLAATALERLPARRPRSPQPCPPQPCPRREAHRAVTVTAAVAAGLFATLYSLLFPLYERDAMIWLVPAAVALLASTTRRHEPGRRRVRRASAAALAAASAVAAVSVLSSARAISSEGAAWGSAETFVRAHPAVPAADISDGWVWDSYHAGTFRAEPRITCYRVVTGASAAGAPDATTVSVPLDVAPDRVATVAPSRDLPAACPRSATDPRGAPGGLTRRRGAPHGRPPRARR